MSALVLLLVLYFFLACLKVDPDISDNIAETRFAVMTDMHYYPVSLVNSRSRSYLEYLKQDAKLTLESEAVIKAAIKDMIKRRVEFVVLAGDVTNEGERLSHEQLAILLKEFTANGIQVFITPGNHDINNGLAYSLLGDTPQKIDSITASDFEEIYYDYGFRQAYSRDTATLSYCTQIKPGLRIITLDASQYKEKAERPLPDGILNEETVRWAENMISKAVTHGDRILGVMHHGLVEHFHDQGKTFSAFLVKNYEEIGARLARAGLDFVFTGHLHAQDVSSAIYDGITIYDIETAALTSAPFAWRLLTLKPDELNIETRYIDDIDFDYGSELPFRQWAMKKVWNGLLELEAYFLKQHNGLSEEQTRIVAPYYARAFMAHFCGDENPDEEDIEFYEKHKSNPKSPFYNVARIFSALWTDTTSDDINLTIPLRKIKKL